MTGELHGAFEMGFRTRENRVALSEFLAEPFVKVIVVDDTVARHYGRVYAGLKRAGTPIPANDMWVAACAIDQGAALDTLVLDGVELGTDD